MLLLKGIKEISFCFFVTYPELILKSNWRKPVDWFLSTWSAQFCSCDATWHFATIILFNQNPNENLIMRFQYFEAKKCGFLGNVDLARSALWHMNMIQTCCINMYRKLHTDTQLRNI